MRSRDVFWAVIFAAALAGAACGDDAARPAPEGQTLDVRATLVDELIVLGGEIRFHVQGTEALVPADARVILDGQIDGRDLEASIGAEFTPTAGGLDISIGWDKIQTILDVNGPMQFFGEARIEIDDLGGALQGVDELPTVVFDFRDQLQPAIDMPSGFEIFANDLKSFPADGILRGGEGVTDLLVQGEFVPEGGLPTGIDATVPVAVGSSRADAQVLWPVSVFGVQPGVFRGSATVINRHTLSGEVVGSNLTVEISLLPSEIDGFDPPGASRGQIMRALGRGFIPSDANLGQSMFFRLDGSFMTRTGTVIDFSGNNAIQVAPESVPDHTEADLVLRSAVEDRGGVKVLSGLTAAPGTFQGTITPVLIDGVQTAAGRPYTGTLTIAPTRQNVFVRFLPNFSETLESFGLRNVEPEIRARIFDVLRRDYTGVNIEFSDQRPDDFVEYSIIEVGGPDPNGAGLFGLDNSAGKDTGNIRLNDIIGSENAESGELGFYVFGGVFIGSFITFSPTLDPSSQIASASFDEIFSPFMGALGGKAVDGSEWPEGPRKAQIEAAISAMGSLIGNTITHEIGHSLGMSFFQEDLFTQTNRFHNDFDEPGAIMDSGANRPFEERVEIKGAPTPYFNTRNAAYLQMILPLE